MIFFLRAADKVYTKSFPYQFAHLYKKCIRIEPDLPNLVEDRTVMNMYYARSMMEKDHVRKSESGKFCQIINLYAFSYLWKKCGIKYERFSRQMSQ